MKRLILFSLASFTCDHHYANSKASAFKTREFKIEHPTWNIYPAVTFDMKVDATTIYGPQFAGYFRRPPSTSFLMDGSSTKVIVPGVVVTLLLLWKIKRL